MEALEDPFAAAAEDLRRRIADHEETQEPSATAMRKYICNGLSRTLPSPCARVGLRLPVTRKVQAGFFRTRLMTYWSPQSRSLP